LLAVAPLAVSACTAPGDETMEEGDVRYVRSGLTSIRTDAIVPVQPGWVRVIATYADVPPGTTFALTSLGPGCAVSPARVASGRVSWDVRWREPNRWLACVVGSYRLTASSGGAEIAVEERTAPGFDIGKPLEELDAFSVMWRTAEAVSEVGTATSPWAAYPAQTVAVLSTSPTGSTRRVAFVEYESLPARHALGIRQVVVFDTGNSVLFELGAGAELADGFELDIDRRGVTRAPVPEETSNPSSQRFDGVIGGTGPVRRWSPFMLLTSDVVLPFTPRFSEATYRSEVLDNHGTPPVLLEGDESDVRYDDAAQKLVAINGARLIPLYRNLPQVDARYVGALGAVTGRDELARTLRGTKAGDGPSSGAPPKLDPPGALQDPASTAKALGVTTSELLKMIANPPTLGPVPFEPAAPPPPVPGASCAIVRGSATPTVPITACTAAAGCPDGTIDRERFTTTSSDPSTFGVVDLLTPYPAGRVNRIGSCAAHTEVQTLETLLNRYYADLGTFRYGVVDGERIAVPEPRAALSVGGAIWAVHTALGSFEPVTVHTRDIWSGRREAKYALPMFPLGEWPALEDVNAAWQSATSPSAESAAWRSACRFGLPIGWCAGHGGPPPSVYRTYSEMALRAGRGDSPLDGGFFAMMHSYSSIVATPISFDDRDTAIEEMLGELAAGLPVVLDFVVQPRPNPGETLPNADAQMFRNGGGWWVPPEMAMCDLRALGYGIGGHEVLVVGAHVERDAAGGYDPYRSYFVVQNNWGKGSTIGEGLYYVSFSAVKALAWAAGKRRLDRRCASVACAYH